MSYFKIQSLKENEWVLLHDFYSETPEPDAPKKKFSYLSPKEKEAAAQQYKIDSFMSVWNDDLLVGFVGFFPDDNKNINLFCVVAPEQRGKGHFSKILKASLNYCRVQFSDYKYIRGLTRKENRPSIRGLEKFSFIRKGSLVEEVQPGVIYEEYILPINE